MAFFERLHQASWRGVPFAIEAERERLGRRIVEHEYPNRDTVWPEDQGKLPPRFSVAGFLVENSAIYGGGDVIDQRNRMRAAAQAKGPGILVHPIYGRIMVTCLSLVVASAMEEGRVFRLEFSFLQGGTQAFPELLAEVGGLLGEVAGLADAAGLAAFSDAVLTPLQAGISSAVAISATAAEWVDRVESLASDATSLYGTISQLGGADYGRYFNGRNAGFLAGLSSPYAGAGSVAELIDLGAANRAAIRTSAAGIDAALAELGLSTTAADVGGATQATVQGLQAAAADPADGVRLLAALAEFAPISPASRTVSGVAVSDLFRRSAAAAVARAVAAYAPASADDAHAVRDQALAPTEAVIDAAGATGADGVFQAFRSLRKALVDDMAARGASLPRLVDVTLPSALPAVVAAQRLYRDAGRAAELVTEADPVHPLFMPRAFRALAN
jgi:prophage DNA circulation protein